MFSFGQTSLLDSPRGSSEVHIYELSKDDLRKVHLDEEGFNEDMLRTFVAKYKKGKKIPALPRGNYVRVSVEENKLSYSEWVVDNLYVKKIPSDRFIVCLYDTLGNIISNAEVKRGNRKFQFDDKTQTYSLSQVKDEEVIEIQHQGVFHYYSIENYQDYYNNSSFFKRLGWKFKRFWSNTKYWVKGVFNPSERAVSDKYTGFVVFNKPKYKPGETVKIKAYLAKKNGSRYNKKVGIRLRNQYNYYSSSLNVDTLLAELTPYQPGMYTYEFQLNEGLDLLLDTDYYLSLETEDKNNNAIRSSFRYEEYELKSINFDFSSEKKEYGLGDSIKVKVQVTDENNLPVYEGRVELLIKRPSLNLYSLKRMNPVYLPDTLWNYTVDLHGVSEKEIVLPDSIFPLDGSLNFQVEASYLSSDNEKHTANLSLSRLNKKYNLDFSLDKGMLTIQELFLGKPQSTEAIISMDGEEGECLSVDTVQLPYTFAIPWFVEDITVETPHSYESFYLSDVTQDQLSYKFYRANDSIYLEVDNPSKNPFWYVVYKKKSEISRGYSTQLNYKIKDTGEEGYRVKLTYLFGGEAKIQESSLPFIQKNIIMDVNTPTTVYPGQQSSVEILVKDKKGNPVKNVDITAYSFTSKFKNYAMPNIPIGGKSRYAKHPLITRYELDDDWIYNATSWMTWKKWANPMGLDTLAFYDFLYPEVCFVHKESTPDSTTLISPFIVISGEVQGVHMLWIDGRLYYAKQAENLDVYTFRVNPGPHHLRFRTYDRDIVVNNFYVEKGKKHIVSFNADKSYVKLSNEDSLKEPLILTSTLLDKKEIGYLSEKEEYELRTQLISIDHTFGEIRLPNLYHRIDLPGYIETGNSLYYINPTSKTSYNSVLRTQVKNPTLAGPFPVRNSMNGLSNIGGVYVENSLLANIEIEGGNQYTLYPNYQKIKQWDKSLIKRSIFPYKPALYFRETLLDKETVEKSVKNKLWGVLSSSSGLIGYEKNSKEITNKGFSLNLVLGVDSLKKNLNPKLIFIEPQKEEDRKYYQLYYGGTRRFTDLPTEELTLHLIFSDTTSYSYPLKLGKRGVNYLKIDTISFDEGSDIARISFDVFNRNIEKHESKNPYVSKDFKDSLVLSPVFDTEEFRLDNQKRKIISGSVIDENKDPIIGATVKIKGTDRGIFTNLDGKFELVIDGNTTLEVLYIGYNSKQLNVSTGNDYTIVLKESELHLDEVVVMGYGTVKKQSLTGSVATMSSDDGLNLMTQELQGKLAGLTVRGAGSLDEQQKPLIIVNGLPYEGSVEDFDVSEVQSINILKDVLATALYGARAANGVIMIETNALRASNEMLEGEIPEEVGNTLRRNFHDDAFWQPKLRTNERGIVNFEVTYPDDITSWNAYFIALGGKNQSDSKQLNINSFKSLSARLSMPHFAVRGDSLRAVGKVANHLGDSLNLVRAIDFKGEKQTESIKMGNSHVDYIPINATIGDSLSLTYSLQMKNGYFDGEERSIPIIEQGLLKTLGDFKVINDHSTHTLQTDSKLGPITLYAEASSLELFMREIAIIDRYPFLCNEQMASKIMALLAKKQIVELQGKTFNEDKKIKGFIRELNKNKNKEGLWGWWNTSESVGWISHHILNTLLDAEKAGYSIDLDKVALSLFVEKQLQKGLSDLPWVVDNGNPRVKGELLNLLILLHRLDASVDYKAYLSRINEQLENSSVKDKLKVLFLMTSIGQKDEVAIDSLLYDSSQSILGSLYWAEPQKANSQLRHFHRPYETNTENTLLAYQILKNKGGHQEELTKIQNYFFECRQKGSWMNIYESSRIIQAIMPDLLEEEITYQDVTLYVNDKKVNVFPYSAELNPKDSIEVKKEGSLPLFITAYQKEWNNNPIKEESKGLKISTVFRMNQDSIADLQEGKSTVLETTLTVDGDAEFVQIEIPIPAGCSYESKGKGSYWLEAHREYYKEKVVIFCNRLTKGEYSFKVELLPRFSGRYTVNPAKAELMYFPTFYGNEVVKSTLIH